jgi:hypothetical protein
MKEKKDKIYAVRKKSEGLLSWTHYRFSLQEEDDDTQFVF